MTDTATVEAASGPALSKRKRWGAAVIAVVVILALGSWAGWAIMAERTADRVDATWTLDCPGTKVGSYHSEPAIHSRPGWKCDVELTIFNDSGRSVHVKGVESSILGSGGGAEIRALSADDAEVHSTSSGGIDAVWDVDVTIPGGESRTLNIAVGWRRDGCNSAGHLSLPDWPTIEFEVLHRSYTYSPDQTLYLRTFDQPRDRHACQNS